MALQLEDATSEDTAHVEIGQKLAFDHLQYYVEELQPLEVYKSLERRLNSVAKDSGMGGSQATWPGPPYESYGRDLVAQLLTAFGWTAA